jgi:hypothetical protein
MSDEDWHIGLLHEIEQDNRDYYMSRLIDRMDDPDYQDYPIVIDSFGVTVPEGYPLKVIKALKRALANAKEFYGVD